MTSGVAVRPGMLTAVAAAVPEEAEAIADRLGRYGEGDVDFGDVALETLPLSEVRRRILVADNDARLFAGRAQGRARRHRAGHGRGAGPGAERRGAPRTSSRRCPAASTGRVAEAGGSSPACQQQRLRPRQGAHTSTRRCLIPHRAHQRAVDAYSEARASADRLAKARAGRPRLVCTDQPARARPHRSRHLRRGIVRSCAPRARTASCSPPHPVYTAVVTRRGASHEQADPARRRTRRRLRAYARRLTLKYPRDLTVALLLHALACRRRGPGGAVVARQASSRAVHDGRSGSTSPRCRSPSAGFVVAQDGAGQVRRLLLLQVSARRSRRAAREEFVGRRARPAAVHGLKRARIRAHLYLARPPATSTRCRAPCEHAVPETLHRARHLRDHTSARCCWSGRCSRCPR
ncbi:hypothetical protein [Streptosporangium vulgare]|uniref:hypothetical protein n=1 Tax=Streptosporangium vulgare TaxID=46190 RepID=UPI0031D7612F